MKFSEMKQAVTEVALAGYVPFVRGLHGIGKSEMMESVAEEIGNRRNKDVAFHQVDMSHIKEGELTGMPVTGKDPETGCTVNTYTLYNLFNEVIKESKEGAIPVIFFDEINRADRVVFNELMPIILNKRVQEITLPAETVILAAGNPEDITKYSGASDDYAVLPMDPALKDRFFIFELEVDPKEWLSWAIKKDENDQPMIHDDIVRYIADYPQNLHFLTENEINPTPRGWKMFSNVYTQINNLKISAEDRENMLLALGGGKIGRETTNAFARFIRETYKPLLKVKDFFDNKLSEKTVKENLNKLKEETATRQYITIANITDYFIEQHEKCLKNKDTNGKRKLGEIYMDILWSVPNDIRVGTIKEVLSRDEKALNTLVEIDPKKVIETHQYLT